jgi:hypothetical protein
MNLHNIPQPEAVELRGDFAWFLWDCAVQEQDTGFLSLEPVEQEVMRAKLSERSAYRAEVVL